MADIDRFYIHPFIEGGGRATIAVEVIRETGMVMYGVAWCSPKDQFSKKKGRLIADGRLDAGKGSAFFSNANTRRELVIEVMYDIAEYLDQINAPQWVQRFEEVESERFTTAN